MKLELTIHDDEGNRLAFRKEEAVIDMLKYLEDIQYRLDQDLENLVDNDLLDKE